jgi:hypothetical protein
MFLWLVCGTFLNQQLVISVPIPDIALVIQLYELVITIRSRGVTIYRHSSHLLQINTIV